MDVKWTSVSGCPHSVFYVLPRPYDQVCIRLANGQDGVLPVQINSLSLVNLILRGVLQCGHSTVHCLEFITPILSSS